MSNLSVPNLSKKNLYNFIKFMPKVELHVHLEGSIKFETLSHLSKRNNIQLPFKTEVEFKNFLKFKDFKHFLDIYTFITSCLKTPDDYELISYQFGCDRAKQNIRYSEVTFSIFSNCHATGLSWQDILEALNHGRMRASKEFGVGWGWIFDILRDEPESQTFVLDVLLNCKDSGVVGLGLTGQENKFSSDNFIKTFETAYKNKFGITTHAGEIAGSEVIWDAINLLHADRIGHGVSCVQDPQLIEFLKQKQIPLEICPTSNISIGVFSNFESHPLRKLWDAGLLLTVNSDDPALFNTDLNNEYKILVDHFGFNINDLEKICLNALHASFLSEEQKQKMDKDFKIEFEELLKSGSEN
jgi:adenosine deaminase